MGSERVWKGRGEMVFVFEIASFGGGVEVERKAGEKRREWEGGRQRERSFH